MIKFKRILAWVFALVVIVLSGCAPQKATPSQQPVQLVLPETRVVADDLLADYYFYQNPRNTYAIPPALSFSKSLMAEQIKAPIAIVMKDFRSDDWFFARTDIIETVQDIESASSVLYVDIRYYEPGADGNYVAYEVYFTDAQFQAKFAACDKPDDLSSQVIVQVPDGESPPSIAQADEMFFSELSHRFSISKSAETDISGVLRFLQGIEVNQPEIVDAIRNYSYPNDEKLSNNPGALKEYECHIYKTIGGLPGDTEYTAYVRKPEILDDIGENFSLGTNEVANFNGAAGGEPYLMVFYERTGSERLGNYMPALLTYMYRATVVDALTKQVVAWEEGCFQFEGVPPERINSYDFEEVDGLHIYTGEGARDPYDLISPYLSEN